MMLSRATLAALLVLAFTALAAFAQDPGQAIVQEKCVKCHNAQRICKAQGVKDRAAWQVTVARMAGKGASLDSAEQEKAVAFLAAQPAGAKPLCAD